MPRCISAVLFALIVVVHDGLDARTLQSAEAPLVDRGVRRAETTEPDDLNNRAAIRESGVYDLRGISGACYFGFRYYDPNTGQWLSREPLGESESLNLYAYCHNDPINSVDVLGLFDQSILPQMEVTGMLDDLKAWWESIWGGDVDTSKKQTGEVTGAGKGGFVGGSANLMTGGLWKLEENPSPASQFGIWGGRAWGGGITALTLSRAGARAPALARGGVATYNFGGRWLGAQATVHGPRVLSNPWVQRGVGYGGTALAGGTFYGMTTNPEFAGEVHTFEQVIPGATGEGLLLGYRGLGMMGRDAKAAFQGVDYLSFAAHANKRSPVQLVPEPLYVVPPATGTVADDAFTLYLKHGDVPSPRPQGFQSHHGVNSVWVENNYLGYVADDAPTILLRNAPNHNATRGLFNQLRAEFARRQGVSTRNLDWGKVSPGEAWRLSEEMLKAAQVPAALREDYFLMFNQYLNTLTGR